MRNNLISKKIAGLMACHGEDNAAKCFRVEDI